MSKKTLIALAVVAAAVVLPIGCGISSYNELISLDQQVKSQWAQVENVYQRRLDLVPNLVETVKGAAAFEKDTFTAVTEARSRAVQAGQEAGQRAPEDPAALQKFQQAQEQLSGALSRLMVVVERYPELKATQNFRDLQVQLEGTENRIVVERMRFNEAAQRFNTRRNSFPTVLFASFFGSRFQEKGYFRADPGAEQAPKVKF
jgi:LemA protein